MIRMIVKNSSNFLCCFSISFDVQFLRKNYHWFCAPILPLHSYHLFNRHFFIRSLFSSSFFYFSFTSYHCCHCCFSYPLILDYVSTLSAHCIIYCCDVHFFTWKFTVFSLSLSRSLWVFVYLCLYITQLRSTQEKKSNTHENFQNNQRKCQVLWKFSSRCSNILKFFKNERKKSKHSAAAAAAARKFV